MKIFEPTEIGSLKLKNRFIRSATWLAGCPAGEVSGELISRYVELAQGGPGLIVTGFAFISPEGAMLPAMIGAENDSRIASLQNLTKAIHSADGDVKVFCQLVHSGIARLPFVRTTYADTFAADETTDPFVEMGGTGETCPAAGEDRIREVIGNWVGAVARCREAGFDGVELHYAHGFGPGAWLSPLWNHRTDDWGGSFENRARYGVELASEVRKAVGDWPVTAKINCDDGVEGGVTIDDAVAFAGMLATAGLDALVVSGGSFAADPKLGPSRLARRGQEEGRGKEGYFAEATAKIKASVDIPVIGVGGWRTPAIMEKHQGTTCDAFALARPLLNDPGLVNKWIENPEHPSGCISCNKCMQGEGMIVCRKDD